MELKSSFLRLAGELLSSIRGHVAYAKGGVTGLGGGGNFGAFMLKLALVKALSEKSAKNLHENLTAIFNLGLLPYYFEEGTDGYLGGI